MSKSKPSKNELANVAGFNELREQIVKSIDAQKTALIEFAVQGLQIGKLINEFAGREEVRAQVDKYNRDRQEKKLGGRPKSYHCFVSEMIVASGVNISKGWLDKCARAEERARLLGCDETSVDKLSLTGLIPSAFTEEDGEEIDEAGNPKKLTFKDMVKAVVAKLDSIRSQAGEVSLKNKKNQEQLASALEDWFERNGTRVSISFKQ